MKLLVRLGERSARLAQAVVPDPFVIAIALAAVAFAGGLLLARGPLELSASFAAGMMEPALLAFGFEMALVLVTGFALAAAPPVRRLLGRLASLPPSLPSAAALVAAVALLLGLLNWGLGLVGGAFFAREVTGSLERRGLPGNRALLGAAGYMGLLVWHGGLSGSAPLKVASAGSFGEAIDIRQTLLSPLNGVVTALLLVLLPLLFFALGRGQPASLAAPGLPPRELPARGPPISGRLERSPWLVAILALPLCLALGSRAWTSGTAAINLQFVILLFLVLGLLLHRRPMAYAQAFGEGAVGAGGILLQFPIYFGVMAVVRDSGVLATLTAGFVQLSLALQGAVSPAVSASLSTFLSSAVVNLFVPSGGGQWALQEPLILRTAAELGVDRARLVMAFAYGDQLTNMLQPFWALPLLAITRLSARDVMGYTLLAMLAATPVFLLGLALL